MFDEVKQPEFLTGEATLIPERVYCLYCVDTSPWRTPSGWMGEPGIKAHLKQQHDMDPELCEEGRDWFIGRDFPYYLAEWLEGNELDASRFSNWLQSIRGPEDLLWETG